MSKYKDLVNMITQGNFLETEKLVEKLLDQGNLPDDIIHKGIITALDIVGKKFSEGECFVPEMLVAAKASQKALVILRPFLTKTNFKPKGKIIIGTVEGDLHDIGKNIVAMTLEAACFQIVDLGVNVAPEKFVEAIKTENPEILALSCLLTTTMPAMNHTLDVLREAGINMNLKVMVGGAPISDDFAKEIGANFRGRDAYEAVRQARLWTAA